MVGWIKIGHFKNLSKYWDILDHAMAVNSPHTNTHEPHVVHNNPIERPTQERFMQCIPPVYKK